MNTRKTLAFLLALVPAAGLLADDAGRPLSKKGRSAKVVTADIASVPSSDDQSVLVPSTVYLYANCDGSTVHPVININDMVCFLNHLAVNSPYANCDGSTGTPLLTANDIQCFLNSFAYAMSIQEAMQFTDPVW